MATFTSSKYADMHERFVENAYIQNPKIQTFEEFVNALDEYLGIASQGEGAKEVMSPDDYKFLFQTKFNKEKIGENLDEDEYKEMFERTDHEVRGDAEYEVIKKKKKEKTRLEVLYVPKKIEVRGYSARGKPIKSYIRGYSKWQSNEIGYLKSLKQKKIPSGEAIRLYRQRFSGSSRSASSIKSKTYRI